MFTIPFVKMHGLGNDYLFVDCVSTDCASSLAESELPGLVRRMSDRHFGIGSDGLVLMLPSDVADLRMRMFNADGSEAQMCGNAARCVAKYAFEKGLCEKREMTLQTAAGIRRISVSVNNGLVESVTVDMGTPEVELDSLLMGNERIVFTRVNIGNPHAVVFTDASLDTVQLSDIGPKIEKHRYFPEGTNVEIVHIESRTELSMRVWERGTGETLACGTGACAAVAVAVKNGMAERNVTVCLKGGKLLVSIEDNGCVTMTGPATMVFSGEYVVE